MSNINFNKQKDKETLKEYITDFNQRKQYIANIVNKFQSVENLINNSIYSQKVNTDSINYNNLYVINERELKIKAMECSKVVKNMSQCSNRFFTETWESEKLEDIKRKSKFFKTCKNKFCAVCCKIRSNKIFHETYNVIQNIKQKNIDYVPFHLTLTIKNPTYDQFDSYFKVMNNAFHLLLDKKQRQPNLKIRNYVLGWQAGREITQSPAAKIRGELHPHMHVLLLLDPKYADDFSIKSLEKQALLEWNYCLKKQDVNFPEVTEVKIAKIKVNEENNNNDIVDNEAIAIAEVSKYPTKPADLIIMEADVLVNLYLSLKNARIITFGGLMKTTRAELKFDEKTVEDKFINEEFYKLVSVHLYNYFNGKYNKQNITKKDLLEHRVISNTTLIEYQHSKNKEKVEDDHSSIAQYLRNDFTELNIFKCIAKYGENDIIRNEDKAEIFEIINQLADEDRKFVFELRGFRKNFVGPLQKF